MNQHKNYIQASSLNKNYSNLAAIQDLNLEIRPGEVVGLLGPNGAGKTTTLRILTGFMPPTSGRVTVAGFDMLENPREAKQRLGYLPETPPLYPELTVEEMLFFHAELRGIFRQARREKVEWAMEKTGICALRRRLVGNLSKGYRQRLGLAGAILHEPSFLILDEPTIGLDPKQILEIRELIRQMRGERAILLSSHILQEVSLVCDRVIIIHKGRIVADGKMGDLLAPLHKKRFLVTVSGEAAAPRSALEKIPGVESVADYASDLEELFLKLTDEASDQEKTH